MTDNKAELKAKELVEKFKPHSWISDNEEWQDFSNKESAKKCAIIAVDLALEYSVKEATAELLKVKHQLTNYDTKG